MCSLLAGSLRLFSLRKTPENMEFSAGAILDACKNWFEVRDKARGRGTGGEREIEPVFNKDFVNFPHLV